MKRTTLPLALALAALTLAACTSGQAAPTSTPTPTPTELGHISDIVELRDAYVTEGGQCTAPVEDGGTFAEAKINCDGSTVLLIFASTTRRDAQLDLYESTAALIGGSASLVGDNWILHTPEAANYQDTLGGEVVEYGE